jgi:hypothetical protein
MVDCCYHSLNEGAAIKLAIEQMLRPDVGILSVDRRKRCPEQQGVGNDSRLERGY